MGRWQGSGEKLGGLRQGTSGGPVGNKVEIIADKFIAKNVDVGGHNADGEDEKDGGVAGDGFGVNGEHRSATGASGGGRGGWAFRLRRSYTKLRVRQ